MLISTEGAIFYQINTLSVQIKFEIKMNLTFIAYLSFTSSGCSLFHTHKLLTKLITEILDFHKLVGGVPWEP